jgi:hypothetical protein
MTIWYVTKVENNCPQLTDENGYSSNQGLIADAVIKEWRVGELFLLTHTPENKSWLCEVLATWVSAPGTKSCAYKAVENYLKPLPERTQGPGYIRYINLDL